MALPELLLGPVALMIVIVWIAIFLISRMEKPEGKLERTYNATDIAYLGVMIAIFGVFTTFLSFIYESVTALFGPLGSGILMFPWYWPGPLCYYFRKKPGMIFLTSVIGSAVQVLLGGPAGIYTMGWGILQGITMEIGVAMSGYKVFRSWLWFPIGMLGSLGDEIWTVILYGWSNELWLQFYTGLIPGVFLAALGTLLLGWGLGKAIEGTGLITAVKMKSA